MNFCHNNLHHLRLTKGAAGLLAAQVCHGAGAFARAAMHNLRVEIITQFNGAPIDFDSVTHTTVAGQEVTLTRLDFMDLNPALRRNDGVWVGFSNRRARVGASPSLFSR